jgi:hypothetical protein
MLGQLERCAALLADRLHAIGGHLDESAWDRTVSASIALSGVTDGPLKAERLIACMRDASRMDSGALILEGDEGRRMSAAVGPLADSLFALSPGELDALSSLVGQIRSCYTGSDTVGRGFVGTDSLRAGGARVVVVLPLWAQRSRVGSVVLAHSRPLQLSGDEVRPLETLADHVASVLLSSATNGPATTGHSAGA